MGFLERLAGWMSHATPPQTGAPTEPVDQPLLTLRQLQQIMPLAKGRAEIYHGPLCAAMEEFGIVTAPQIAMFLANVAHESGELKYVEELASGEAYEFRDDLGNTEPGDGRRYKGRGLMQLTGRESYLNCGLALGVDFVNHPELLEEPQFAARSAGWFWFTRSLGVLADRGQFKAVVRKINGGTNGLQSRLMYWERAKAVLGVDAS